MVWLAVRETDLESLRPSSQQKPAMKAQALRLHPARQYLLQPVQRGMVRAPLLQEVKQVRPLVQWLQQALRFAIVPEDL